MSYIRSRSGPGDIASLPPTFGLSMPPTIGASSTPRNIPNVAPKASPVPSMFGCMGEEGGLVDMARPYVVPAAIGALAYLAYRKYVR